MPASARSGSCGGDDDRDEDDAGSRASSSRRRRRPSRAGSARRSRARSKMRPSAWLATQRTAPSAQPRSVAAGEGEDREQRPSATAPAATGRRREGSGRGVVNVATVRTRPGRCGRRRGSRRGCRSRRRSRRRSRPSRRPSRRGRRRPTQTTRTARRSAPAPSGSNDVRAAATCEVIRAAATVSAQARFGGVLRDMRIPLVRAGSRRVWAEFVKADSSSTVHGSSALSPMRVWVDSHEHRARPRPAAARRAARGATATTSS